ncbi:MAG: gluconokinase [Chloroflexi bacterium]|nr:gluconokinase [Chloroflexota bacterium]
MTGANTIGLDLGTTNCKAVALDADGSLLGSASSEHRLYTPQSGWGEQRAEDVWAGALAALSSLAQQIPARAATGICLSGAMHSSLAVDGAGNPLAPALTWADLRSAAQVPELRGRCDAHALYLRTGCPLVYLYHPAKLHWWHTQMPEVASRAARFALVKDWVLYRLTGVWAADFSTSSATGLLDIRRLEWDAEALELAGVTPQQLPPLVSPCTIVGMLLPEVARAVGLPAGLPVIAGASDGGLANLGSGAAAPGQSVITVGTSGAVRRLVAQPLLDERERTWCYLLAEKRWFAGGAINNGGLALQWVRERFYPELAGEAGYERLFAEAASVPAGAEGVLLLPYFAGERNPHWDPAARAMLVGLGLEHGRAHVARAVLEGVAFCLADVWQALEDRRNVATEDKEDRSGFIAEGSAQQSAPQGYPGRTENKEEIEERAVNSPIHLTGGITRSALWMQILADVLGERLAPVEAADASAAGAAMLGQCALGQIGSLEEAAGRVKPGEIVAPDLPRHAAYIKQHKRWQGLYEKMKVRPVIRT